MTKKKYNKQKHQKDVPETSEEELNESSYHGKCCPHVPRGVNFGRVKKTLKTGNLSVCNGCIDSVSEAEGTAEVWLCLQCGYRGCGRMSTNKHGLQHFKTIHSDCHSLVLSPSSGAVWCYECDDEVQLQSSRNLRQCVEFIMKLKVNSSKTDIKMLEEKKPTSNIESLCEVGLKEQASVKSITPEADLKKAESLTDNKSKKDSIPAKKDSISAKKGTILAKKDPVPAKVSVKGLRNLGNTCYFNAVMQSLSQTALLFHVLDDSCSKDYKWEVPRLKVVDDSIIEDVDSECVKIALPREFQLVNTFLQFLKQISASSPNKVEVINPNDLFTDLQRKSPQFQYFLQQDSHELLRQFLDGIRQDEVKRQKKAILRHFNANNINPEDIDDEVKRLIKAYGCYASHTIVEKIFGGLLISTVLCEECKMSSQVFEPFMDMSLPLFEEKQQEGYDQPCPLLDGGKQDAVKALRIRKPDQDNSENSEEYSLKSRKDSGKPSKYQEKKMKVLERKEKKKNKKAQIKKNLTEPQESPMQDLDNSLEPVDNENGEHMAETVENSSKPVDNENGEQIAESIGAKTEESVEDFSNLAGDGETVNHEISMEDENLHYKGLVNGENFGSNDEILPQNDKVVDHNIHPEAGDSLSLCTDVKTVENDETDFLVLFDKVVLLNEESMETSSLTQENNEETPFSDEDHLDPESEKSTTDASTLIEQSPIDISETFEKCVNISPINSSELDERMHSLSMQVKEVRIRRDSDRQESILSSSQSVDECESPKTNHSSYDSFEDNESNEKDENWSHHMSESQTKDWILKSLSTLKSRKLVCPQECSVDSCLMHFTKPELLTGNNKFRCENCSTIKCKKTGDKKAVVYSNASKQLLIFSPPAILTLHLKRFQQVGMSLRKVNRFVEFPLTLDLAPYCSSACLILPHMTSVKNEILYSLYGIVEHSGHLRSGHYTAYVKVSKRTLNHSFICHLPLAHCDLEQLLHKFSKSSSSSSEDGSAEIGSSEEVRWYYISDSHVKEVSEAQILKCQAYLLFYERIK